MMSEALSAVEAEPGTHGRTDPADRAAPSLSASRKARSRFSPDEFFGHQPTSTVSLPAPDPLVENLTRCVIEILAGARELEQISRWVTDSAQR